MITWWKDNWKWVTPILTMLWGAFAFAVGHYVSFRETKAEIIAIKIEVQSIKESNGLFYEVVKKAVDDNTTFKNYIMFKENK